VKVLFINRMDSFPVDNCKYLFLEMLHSYGSKFELFYAVSDWFYSKIDPNFVGSVLPYSKVNKILEDVDILIIDSWLDRNLTVDGNRVLQLWHGIGVKNLKKVSLNFYNPRFTKYLLVTSEEVLYLFENFQYEKLLVSGYPRNLALIKSKPEYMWECDLRAIERIENFSGKKVFLAPTFRRDGPILRVYNVSFFERLNRFACKYNLLFVIKLHAVNAFDFNMLRSLEKNFSNLAFYDPSRDIYPALAYADFLITDYSSILFDFFWLEKEFLLYLPDFEDLLAKEELVTSGVVSEIWNWAPIVKSEVHLFKYLKSWLKGGSLVDLTKVRVLRDKVFKNQYNCTNKILSVLT